MASYFDGGLLPCGGGFWRSPWLPSLMEASFIGAEDRGEFNTSSSKADMLYNSGMSMLSYGLYN